MMSDGMDASPAQPTHLERALTVTPGASQTRSKAPGAVGPRDVGMPFPLFAEKAVGYTVQADGKEYIDCFGANAAVPLGYADWRVASAVRDAALLGPLLPLPSRKEAEVSELFLSICAPWAAHVRWLRTGSEAVSAAVRYARLHTGRARIVAFGSSYHGWHDVSLARFSEPHDLGSAVFANGVPSALGPTIALAEYGKPVDKLVGPDTAALLVEAHRFQPTDHEWLRAVCDCARMNGALVIFDEMVYGLRWRKGGAAEYYGVTPDMACFGKALGNGVPVACVCALRGLIDQPGASFVSGTYGGDLIGLCAAEAVLRAYDSPGSGMDVIARLWESGRNLRGAFALNAPPGARLEGFDVHWRLVMPNEDLLDRTLMLAARDGLLVHRASNNSSSVMPPHVAFDCGTRLARAAAQAMEHLR